MGVLDGSRALVTGGASGIGLATVMQLLSDGATVAALDKAVTGPTGAVYVQADLSDDAAVQAAVATAIDTLGGLDILVNNAGIGAQGTVEETADSEWHQLLQVNVVGTARVTRAALPALRRSTHGSIVNVSSIVAMIGLPRRVAYSATKGAILAMTRAMATDLIHDGVRVNAVIPGTVDTPWIGRLLAAADDPVAERRMLEARQPQGRLITAEEVARAIVHLASPLSGSTTGTALAVDGGLIGLRPGPAPQ
jgi:2-keto-3-deoxy-L-fuconate dehydrogenase